MLVDQIAPKHAKIGIYLRGLYPHKYMPTLNIVPAQGQDQQSPFDSIRRIDEYGQEYWSARELMKWLGYVDWRNAEKAISRASKSLENQGGDILLHLVEVNEVAPRAGAGSLNVKDYCLSRLACYTIAMNSDPEKEMVAQAQNYFAVKTREAEIAPITKLPTVKELAYMLIAAEEAREALEAQIDADASATALGKIIEESKSQNMRIGDFAKILGDVGQHQYFDELRAEKIIISGTTVPYQQYINAGYFRVTQVPGKGEASDKWFTVSLITPKGQAYLAKRHKKMINNRDAARIIEAQVSALV